MSCHWLKMGYSWCGGGVKWKWCLPIENNVDTSISTPKGYVGLKPLMLGKMAMDGLGLTNVDLKPCPY